MEDTPEYIADAIGLRSLTFQNKVLRLSLPCKANEFVTEDCMEKMVSFENGILLGLLRAPQIPEESYDDTFISMKHVTGNRTFSIETTPTTIKPNVVSDPYRLRDLITPDLDGNRRNSTLRDSATARLARLRQNKISFRN